MVHIFQVLLVYIYIYIYIYTYIYIYMVYNFQLFVIYQLSIILVLPDEALALMEATMLAHQPSSLEEQRTVDCCTPTRRKSVTRRGQVLVVKYQQ